MNSLIALCKYCELVEVHDETGERMNTSVVVDINVGNAKQDAVDGVDKEWRLENFVPNEYTEDDEPWDREDKVFDDAKLTNQRA